MYFVFSCLHYKAEICKKSRMFAFIRQRNQRKKQAAHLYDAAVVQSRQPEFYADLNVPDTVDGRFEMLALHCGILVYGLKNDGKSMLSQALFDKMFKVMDPMLREMGVGDLSVPKHMKRMMQGFNGRIINYTQAIEKEDKIAMQEALRRNVYGTVLDDDVNQNDLAILANYVFESTGNTINIENPQFGSINFTKEKGQNATA